MLNALHLSHKAKTTTKKHKTKQKHKSAKVTLVLLYEMTEIRWLFCTLTDLLVCANLTLTQPK